MSHHLVEQVRDALIGERILIETPYGQKPLVYADYTASGRSLTFIEDFLRQAVLPRYANTHTEASYTGASTSQMRESARQIIATAVNARPDDQVIFCGTGATAAIHKLIRILGLEKKSDARTRPVVFIGPYEHHSNELPWREAEVDLVVIPLDEQGSLDIKQLEHALAIHESRPCLIGSFSAASNVTGLKTDIDAVSELLLRYGALSCWDFAAAAPYMKIDMQSGTSKDAIFISPHKFPGGPGTPGVLVVRGALLQNAVPTVPGGGTVSFVSPSSHQYVEDKVRREEGGTPGIVESIRAGLVFKLQQDIGIPYIEEKEDEFVKRALSRWCKNPDIEILGNPRLPRLAIFSLRICHGKDYLPYGFVVALLNDLFGIQARGGCSCAGPYAHHLLKISEEQSRIIESQVANGEYQARPGWVRLGFNYFMDDTTIEYLLRAIELIAAHAWRLLESYQYVPQRGVWLLKGEPDKESLDLSCVDFTRPVPVQADVAQLSDFDAYLGLAERQLRAHPDKLALPG